MNAFDALDPQIIGERLKSAREDAKLTQADVATDIGLARTTLLAIEKGERKVRIEELQLLAAKYGKSINALLRAESIHTNMMPRFRKLSEATDPDSEAAIKLLNDLVSAEVELENLLGIEHVHNYPPERPILPGDEKLQAEQDAFELRSWLGLGASPIKDIIYLLELELGVRVFVRPLPSKISGLFAYDDNVGACVLLNSNHPHTRRLLTATHELGHLVSTRRSPEIYDDKETFKSRTEKYADCFGRAFAMPARSVAQKFKEITAGSAHLTRRHVVLLSDFYGVSIEALVRRLEELKLVRPGTWDWFSLNDGFSGSDTQDLISSLSRDNRAEASCSSPLSTRLGLMVAEVWKRELMSEGQLSSLLKISRLQLRSFLDDLNNANEGEANDLLKLPR